MMMRWANNNAREVAPRDDRRTGAWRRHQQQHQATPITLIVAIVLASSLLFTPKEVCGNSSSTAIQQLDEEIERIIKVFQKHRSVKIQEFMDVYPPLFARYTLSPYEAREKFALLEIGNRRGETLRAYLEIFPEGDIWGLDLGIDDYKTHNTAQLGENHRNCHLYQGDQANVELLKQIGEAAIQKNGGFDFINDDGGHAMHHQKTSLAVLWHYLKPGGYYVIEDIETSYYKVKGYGGGPRGKKGTTIDALKDLVDVINRDFHNGPHKVRVGAGSRMSIFPESDTALSVQIYKNAAIIQKSKTAPKTASNSYTYFNPVQLRSTKQKKFSRGYG